MYEVLKAQGVTEIEFLALTAWDHENQGPTWEFHHVGFEAATFPVLPDKVGVQYIYSADYYDVILVDKKGRLVTKQPFSPVAIEGLNKRIRELHAE